MGTSGQKPVLRFLLTASGLYLLWYILYDLWIHPAGWLDNFIIKNSILLSKFVLSFAGYGVFISDRLIGIENSGGVWIGDPCNGVALFALFAGFIIAYPGKASMKLLFIPLGILSIHLLNVLRIISLLLIQNYAPSVLDFNHTYTFTFLVYGYIFILWMIWVKKITYQGTLSGDKQMKGT